jgi:hypothetical protein
MRCQTVSCESTYKIMGMRPVMRQADQDLLLQSPPLIISK